MLLLAMASCSENEYLDEEYNVTLKADIAAPEEVLIDEGSRTFIDENDAYSSSPYNVATSSLAVQSTKTELKMFIPMTSLLSRSMLLSPPCLRVSR